MNVGRRMTRDLKTVGPDDPLSRAADVMKEFRIHHLLVVDGQRLVGILSDTEMRNASLTSAGAVAAGTVSPRELKVRDVMQTEVWSLTPEDSVEDALLIISRKKFGALPVLSGDRLVGIITKADLLEAFKDVLDIDDVGLRIEVSFTRDLSRFEELVAVLKDLGVTTRSCIITPRKGSDRMIALLRLDTINGPLVKAALRAKRYEVLDPADAI